jgi:hypothetical protein
MREKHRLNLIKSKKPKTAKLIDSTKNIRRYSYGRDDVYVPKKGVKLTYCPDD